MNFNVGGFSESIKYSYQQFCKQDAEGRESNRRLLVKLKKFEAKSFDLVAQTQVAQQMRNQYERTLMQQNPVLWAQIQRNIATDMTDFELERPLTGHGGRKHTREMAMNTSHNSSTSEQHSLHEEGVWPHTPSPFPEFDAQQFASDQSTHLNIRSSTLAVPHSQDTLESLNKTRDSKVSNSHSALQNESLSHHQGHIQDKHPLTSVPDFQQPAQNIVASPQVDDFIPASSSTPNVMAKQRKSYPNPPSIAVSNLELLKEESIGVLENNLEQEKDVKLTTTIELKTPLSSVTEIPAANPITTYDESQKVSNDEDFRKLQPIETVISDEVAQHVSPHQSPQKIKPFCLDSESDGADDPISGPLSGRNVGDDDSDSFWN
jgi:hypothetical protein